MFDTDAVSCFLRGKERAAARTARDTDRVTSVVTYMEVVQGAPSQGEVGRLRRTLQQAIIRILPLTESIGAAAAELMHTQARSSDLEIPDALIAATARREHGQVLVTANLKHFRNVAGLDIEAFRR